MPRPCVLVCVVLAAVAGCESEPPVDVSWHQEAGYRWHALPVPSKGHAGFAPFTAPQTGLTHANVVDDAHAVLNRTLLIGAGVALGDIDGDGLPDVFLASVERPAALYRNDGKMHFTDITAASGIDTRGLATTSAVFADLDGDGNLDLLVGTLAGPVKLWIGDGKGHFRDSTIGSGLVGGYAAATITLADVDGDGDLDVFVSTYKTKSTLDAVPPNERLFSQVVQKVGNNWVVVDKWKKDYRVEDRPDLGGVMRSQRAEPDLFFLNDGHAHFTLTPVVGPRFRDEAGKPLTQEPDYFTLAARFYDVNGDGAPDLYVCNDFEDPDQLWLNDGKGNFRLVPWHAMRQNSNACMSVDFADINRDGYVDFFTADMLSPTLAARQRQLPTHSAFPKPVGLVNDRPQWMRNTLQLGRGDGSWAQIADYANVVASDWTWGSAFLDVDLDGYEDLVVAAGHRWDVRDADTFERIRRASPAIAWNQEQKEFPRLDAHNRVYRNGGDLAFSDRSAEWGIGGDSSISQGIALADLDGDGALDVVVTRLGEPPVIYKATSNAPRVAIRLKGVGANTRGIGALVTVRARGLPAQSRQMTSGGYYLSGGDAALTFATGTDSLPTIEVRWQSGALSTITNAHANRLYEVDEAAATAKPRTIAPPQARPPRSDSTLFEDATPLLNGHRHVDSLFDDFQRQPLLPNRFSQLGPGVSWIDVDGDGREDLVVGTGRGGRLSVLHNERGHFVDLARGSRVAQFDLTTILPVPGASGLSLASGQSNYETASPTEALGVAPVITIPLVRGAPGTPRALAAPETASVGPLALADVNGDGRLDLFVGARVVPGAWPLPAASQLYLRAATGEWVRDSVNAPLLASLGLVSSAIFTDLDGDGQPDLVVAIEFGPIRVLHNERGRLRDVTKSLGLGGMSSRWLGLAAGDFDGDGRMDLVVTSFGRNTPWQASTERPYELVVGNFGGDGMGLVFARRDSITKQEMPLAPYAKVAIAVHGMRDRIPTYADFATADVDRVLGPASTQAVRIGATTFDQLLLLNRGDHFEARPLPTMAQMAPAFGVVVADYDGDGREDVFLAQNFFPTDVDTPRFDAGQGLLLLGDGRGGFRPLPVREAGISVMGDQRGAAAADYDGDGRVDLAVSQNGNATTLWHNRKGIPGLRVHLDAGPDNPLGIGAQIRIVRGSVKGAVREVHAGAGYWSMDGATTVLARPSRTDSDSLAIRWPGGRSQVVPLARAENEVTVRMRPAH